MNKLNDFMAFLLQSLQQGKDFIAAEAPATVRQVLAYYFYFDILLAMALLGSLFPQAWLLKYNWRQAKKKGSYDNDINLMAIAFLGVTTFLTCIAFIANIADLLKLTLAPNLYLLEWAKSMLKG